MGCQGNPNSPKKTNKYLLGNEYLCYQLDKNPEYGTSYSLSTT